MVGDEVRPTAAAEFKHDVDAPEAGRGTTGADVERAMALGFPAPIPMVALSRVNAVGGCRGTPMVERVFSRFPLAEEELTAEVDE